MDSLPPKSQESLFKEATITRPGRSKPANLRDQVSNMHMWPTPTASNSNEGESIESWSLRRENVKKQKKNGNGFGMPLAIAVRMFPTPLARDHRKGQPKGWTKRQGTKNLNDSIAEKENNFFLNPEWIEWLMYWPLGWTSLETMNKENITDWLSNKEWFKSEPVARAVNKGFKHRAERIKALGNGQVPSCAALAWQILLERTNNNEIPRKI